MSTQKHCTSPTTRTAPIQQETEPPLSATHQGGPPVAETFDNAIKSEFDPDKGRHQTKEPSITDSDGVARSIATPTPAFGVAEEPKVKASSGATPWEETEPRVELEANGLVRRVFRMPDGRRLTQYSHNESIATRSLKEGNRT